MVSCVVPSPSSHGGLCCCLPFRVVSLLVLLSGTFDVRGSPSSYFVVFVPGGGLLLPSGYSPSLYSSCSSSFLTRVAFLPSRIGGFSFLLVLLLVLFLLLPSFLRSAFFEDYSSSSSGSSLSPVSSSSSSSLASSSFRPRFVFLGSGVSLQVSWSPLCREDLLWWARVAQLREGVSLSLPAPDVSFFSDASDVGWGALVGEHHTSGLWSPHQKTLSINLRALLAVQYGLKAFEHLLVGLPVALFCDNTTTVAYLRRSGGTFSSTLNATAREVLLWAESHRVRLLPQFIMGSSNVTADPLSRPNQVIGSEWTLHQEVVDQLVHKWPAVIDLFATSLTARLPVYFSPASDPRAAGTDALLQPWDDLQAYAFPPIAVIRRVLLKLRSSKNCELTLIAPFWPQREWFLDLLELLSDVPITLSGRKDLLRQPHFHRFHLNLPMLQLTAWRLSSDSPVRPASLLRWLDSLSSVEDCPHA